MIDQEDSWLMMGEEKNSARAWWEKISYIVSRGAPRRELPPGFFRIHSGCVLATFPSQQLSCEGLRHDSCLACGFGWDGDICPLARAALRPPHRRVGSHTSTAQWSIK